MISYQEIRTGAGARDQSKKPELMLEQGTENSDTRKGNGAEDQKERDWIRRAG